MDGVLNVLDEYEISEFVHAIIYVDKDGFRRYRPVEPPSRRRRRIPSPS